MLFIFLFPVRDTAQKTPLVGARDLQPSSLVTMIANAQALQGTSDCTC